MYEQEIKFLNVKEDPEDETNHQRELLSDEEISKLLAQYPKLPDDYIEYLKQVGWGSFRECQYMVHEPISPLASFADMYFLADNPPDCDMDNYLVFGDDFCGDLGLINLKTQQVAVLLHESTEIYEITVPFYEFIRKAILIDDESLVS